MLSKSISGTTDGTGDINLGLNVLENVVPIAYVNNTNQGASYSFFNTGANGAWWMKLVDDANASNFANKATAGTLYYAETV